MKKLLIMGANPETVSLIKKAKEMGCYTIVTDNDPNAFAKKFADKPMNVDAMDVDGLVELAIQENVDGVVVGVAEALLKPYCEVCKKLNKPCFSTTEKFETMIKKDSFKKACREYGVPTIEEYDESNLEAIVYPVIVKPTDSCSSKGITVCYDKSQLTDAIEYAKSFSKSGHILIEKYMSGDEVISYYVMQDGEPVFVGMCDRYTYKQSDNTVQLPTAYIFPSRHIESYIKNTDLHIKEMIKGLGLENGSIFFQCFVDENGIVRTYEPGYRLNGAQEHIIVSKVSGIDAKELYINYALNGAESDVNLSEKANPRHKEICCKLSPLVKTGKIAELSGLEEISELDGVVSVNPSYNVGDTVSGYGTLKQIVCRFFIVSDNKQNLISTINKIYRILKVRDKSGNDMLIGQFDTDLIDKLY